jgi:hypothetical protein
LHACSGRKQVLRIRAYKDLPEHKVVASLDDLDRDILEMHQKDVFFSYAELANTESFIGLGLYEQKFELGVID